jgi:hypothetical protein
MNRLLIIGLICATVLGLLTFGAAASRADCPDRQVECWGPHPDTGVKGQIKCGTVTIPTWYDYGKMDCLPADNNICPQRNTCNQRYPQCCSGSCYVFLSSWRPGSWSCPGWDKP